MSNEKIAEEKEELRASTVLKVVCFLIPLVGLIIYACNISINRKFATECGKISLISVIIAIILPVIIIGAMFLLGAGIAAFNASVEIETMPTNNLTSMEIASFNSEFLAYEGTKVSGRLVKALINLIEAKESNNKVDILLNDKSYLDTTKAKNEISNTSEYSVKFEYNTKGLVDKVIITEKETTVKIPNVWYYEDLEEAKTELEKLGLMVEVVEQYSDTIEKGQMIGTTPACYTTVNKGDIVKIHVSKGKYTDSINNVERGE